MDELVKQIRETGRASLAEIISENHSKTIKEYSSLLLDHKPKKPLEKILIESFKEELRERGYKKKIINKVLKEIQKHRVIQTSPHTSLVPNPRMFCIDWLSTRALTNDRVYIVGSFSGIPFSNSAKPGRVAGINFIPKTHQDALVYESPIFEKSLEVFKKEQPSETLNPKDFTQFSDWSCANSETLHQQTIHPNVVYLDINKIITRYLLKIIHNENHPVYKLLFDETWRKIFMKHFGKKTHLFYGGYKSKKYRKQESLYFDGYDLSGDYQEIHLSRNGLQKRLQDRTLCPATILTFTILTFLNDFKCLGSFMQVEYLSDFKEKWIQTELLKDIDSVKTKNLSTGQFVNFSGTAIDFKTSETALPNPETTTMSELWLAMKHLFIR